MGLFRRSRNREAPLLDDAPEDAAPDGDDWDDADPEAFDDVAESGGGWLGLVSKVLAVVVLAGVAAGAIVLAYSWGVGQRDGTEGLPIVEVAPTPEKVQPEDPGGLDVPYQDTLALNESLREAEQSEPERLLPPPETPQPGADPAAEAAPDPEAAPAPDQPVPEEPAPDQPALDEPVPEDRVLKDSAASGAASGETGRAEPRPARKPAEAQAARTAPDLAPESAPDSAPAEAERPGAGDVVPDGAILIQLASIRDQARAEGAWADMKTAHPNLLSSQRLRLQKVEIADQGVFWRVRTGPFPNRATADDMCRQLQARGQPCLVVRK